MVAQPGQNPALHQEHAALHPGLVPRHSNARRDNGRAVVVRHVLVGRIRSRFIAAGSGDGALEVIGHQQFGHTPHGLEAADMRGDPVRQRLGPGGLGIGVVTGPQGGHTDLGLPDLPRGLLDTGYSLPRVVHEQLLTGPVVLAHNQVQRARPDPVAVAELAVLDTIGVHRLVLLPQQQQGDARAPVLLMDGGPIRHRAGIAPPLGQAGEQGRLQLPVIPGLRQGPAQMGIIGAAQVFANRGG